MARDYSKQQSYYRVTVYFRHKTKTYTLSTKQALDEFLRNAKQNETIIHYVVEAVSNFIYPEYKNR
ncbi:MAG: hypothetical protein J0H92_07860 [Sphingobacteriales bacterium]|nr:hypothetical protein [Sphingobacteriales bacterium]OJW30091.1 MAG: hypothetical protein BGO54_00400 [Sphingobacteriales bacterium 46-32]